MAISFLSDQFEHGFDREHESAAPDNVL